MNEGGLAAPSRHPLDWQSPDFYYEAKLDAEMRRVFDICHGCRRCFNLCDSFKATFDLSEYVVDISRKEGLAPALAPGHPRSYRPAHFLSLAGAEHGS
jgi:hypothetical protein